MSAIIKQESTVEEKKKFHPPASAGGVDDAELLLAPAAVYVCANCTTRVTLTAETELKCATCEHLTGSSTVFYKVRNTKTQYDTI